MKKLSEKRRRWLNHLSQRTWREYKARLRGHRSAPPPPSLDVSSLPEWAIYQHTEDGRLGIRSPTTLSFLDNTEETTLYLAALRKLARDAVLRKMTRTVDFTTIKDVRPAAALCVVSEFDRWRKTSVRGGRLAARDLEEWDPHVRRLLHEMGFFEVLNLDVPAPEGQHSGQRWIKFKTGVSNDGQIAKELRVDLEDLAGSFPRTQLLYEALVEAMANAIDHAYPDNVDDFLALSRLGKRWWMSGSVDKENGRVLVIFYDQGISIPRSLPRSNWSEKARGILAHFGWASDDSHMIAAAILMRRSATEQEHRGKGFANILRLVDANPENKLRIISRRGSYTYSPGQEPIIKENDQELSGTLIAWDLSLAEPPLSGSTP